MTGTGKSRWPELVGADVDDARSVIAADRPDLHVQPVGTDDAVTADFRTDRVWVWFDPSTRRVTGEPHVG